MYILWDKLHASTARLVAGEVGPLTRPLLYYKVEYATREELLHSSVTS